MTVAPFQVMEGLKVISKRTLVAGGAPRPGGAVAEPNVSLRPGGPGAAGAGAGARSGSASSLRSATES